MNRRGFLIGAGAAAASAAAAPLAPLIQAPSSFAFSDPLTNALYRKKLEVEGCLTLRSEALKSLAQWYREREDSHFAALLAGEADELEHEPLELEVLEA